MLFLMSLSRLFQSLEAFHQSVYICWNALPEYASDGGMAEAMEKAHSAGSNKHGNGLPLY